MTKFALRAAALGAALFVLQGCGSISAIYHAFDPAPATEAVTQADTTVITNAGASADASVSGTAASAAATTTTTPPVAGTAEKIVFDLRAGYDAAFLVPASAYSSQPRCGTSGAPPAPFCSDFAIVTVLNKVDTAAKSALDVAEDTVRNHPTVSADGVIAVAKNAITAAETILATYNIH